MTAEHARDFFEEHFPKSMSFSEAAEKLERMGNFEGEQEVRRIFCDVLLSGISAGFLKYDEDFFQKNELVDLFCRQVEKLPQEEDPFFWSIYYYFRGKSEKAKKSLQAFASQMDQLTESDFIGLFWEPFKQGWPGFWQEVLQVLKKQHIDKEIIALCSMIEKYYAVDSLEEKIDTICLFIQGHPNFLSPTELLADTYYQAGMWKNAIACFESVSADNLMLFLPADYFFLLAWSFGKSKEHEKETACYRKGLDYNPNIPYLLNNLAYSLYLQKKYQEAKEILEKCLSEKRDLPYAANNYVRVLIALGRNKDAKDFVKNTDAKVSKALKTRVQKLDNTNRRKHIEEPVDAPAEEAIVAKAGKSALPEKQYQFASEKILEDDLTMRLEAGQTVFGMNLKIYRRPGAYGRQYIIPIGRLDLLCEDDAGNLYIVELKKDSGYDDAYKQTAAYLDWFEKNDISKGKKVYGIICLNSPSAELVEKIRSDKRIRLFEYTVSYAEIS